MTERKEKHPFWKGDKAGLLAKHSYIERYKGKPRFCEFCKRTDKKRYNWANIDHSYSRDLTDYIRLCTSCHSKFDYQFNNKSKRKPNKIWSDKYIECQSCKSIERKHEGRGLCTRCYTKLRKEYKKNWYMKNKYGKAPVS